MRHGLLKINNLWELLYAKTAETLSLQSALVKCNQRQKLLIVGADNILIKRKEAYSP